VRVTGDQDVSDTMPWPWPVRSRIRLGSQFATNAAHATSTNS